MSRSLPILENAKIASPCSMSWNAMRGDDRTRFCNACEKNVYNLVGMTDDEVTALIHEKEGRLCVRLYQRPDGTLITSDCPVGLRAARRKLARAVGAIAACIGFVLTAASFGAFGAMQNWRLRDRQPFARITNMLNPPPPRKIAGDICIPGTLIRPQSAPVINLDDEES